jgi:hypothetical protein
MLNHEPNVDDSAEMTHSLRILGTRVRAYWIILPVKRSRPSQKAQAGFGQNSP